MNRKKTIALLFAFLLLLSAVLTGCGAKGNKDVALEMTWRATQEEGKDQVEVEVTFRVSYASIDAPAAADNTFAVGGTAGTFTTPHIKSNKQGSDVLYKYTASLPRRTGESVNCPVSASYHLNSKMNGGYVGWLNFSETLRIDDSNVTLRRRGTTDPAQTEPRGSEPPVTEPVTEPIETKPAETDPPETKPRETKPVETDPPETKPRETKPRETKPVEPEEPIETEPLTPGRSDITLEDGYAEWTVKTDTGTRLNLYAECEASEREDGTVHVSVNLFLEHATISCGPRYGCLLAVGSDSVTFDSQKISQTEEGINQTFLASIDVNVEKGKDFDLEASFPFGGVYGKKQIGTLRILQTCKVD